MSEEKLADLMRRYHYAAMALRDLRSTTDKLFPQVLKALKEHGSVIVGGYLYMLDDNALVVRQVKVLS